MLKIHLFRYISEQISCGIKRTILVGVMGMGLLSNANGVFAQEVEQRLDSLQLLIGEQTALHLKVSAKKGSSIVMPSFKPSQQLVTGIEVVEQNQGDTIDMGNGNIQVSRDYILTSFDEKVYVIPALPVKVNGKVLHGNQLALKVLTVPVDTIHPEKFYPLKGVQDNPFAWSEWSLLFWLSVLFVILCVAVSYLRVRLKQNKPIVLRMRIVKRIPAHQKALEEINVIKHHHTANQDTRKEYYTKLTNTLREYIEKRFGFRAMEMTSSEIIEHLQNAGDQKMIDELRALFRTADLVKFAKYETLLGENDANLVNAINFIDKTKTDEVPVEEKIAPTLSDEQKHSRSQRHLVKILLWLSVAVAALVLAYVLYGTYVLLV